MSIQVQYNNSRASEAPAARPRQERGAWRDDKAFALPEPTRNHRETAPAQKPKERPAARASSAEDKRADAAEPSKADSAEKTEKAEKAESKDKDEAAAKPEEAGAPKKPEEQNPVIEAPAQSGTEKTEQAQPLTGADFLIAMAAAQAGAKPDTAADAAEKPPVEGEDSEGKGKQAGTTTGQPIAASIVVPLPAVPGSELAGGEASAEGQATQPVAGDAGAHAAKAALALAGKEKADGKAEAKPAGDSASQTAPATAAVDHKPFEMLLQPAIKADPGKLILQLDPTSQMQNAAGTAAGQAANAGTGVPTPVHLVPMEIGLRAMSGSKQFDIRLDPAELGRVDVNLSISDKGEVSAKLVVDRVETLHLLQRDARTLERAFEQAGLKPSDGGVEISLRDPSDQSAFRQNRQHDEAPQRPRTQHGTERTDDASLSIEPVPQRRLVRLGGVDLSI